MNSNLEIFSNPEFGQVRVIEKDGESWLVGKDIAEALGYSDTNKAIAMHVDDDDKLNDKLALSLGQRGGWFVNESGFYSLVLSSKLPTAKKFKHWVTSEVLPSIRKHDAYINGQEEMSDMELMARAVLAADSMIKEKDKKIAEQDAKLNEQAQKVAFAEKVTSSKDMVTVSQMAKLLHKKNHIEIGQRRLFQWLRENKYLRQNNEPYQQYMDRGYFKVAEYPIMTSEGYKINTQTYITGAGQLFLIKKLVQAMQPVS